MQLLAAPKADSISVFTSAGPIGVIVNTRPGAPVADTFKLCSPLVNTSVNRIIADGQRRMAAS